MGSHKHKLVSFKILFHLSLSLSQVLDARDVNTTKDMFEAICDHLRYATNGGNIR